MDYESHKARLLASYIAKSKLPGWKAYVWHRVQEMARECPELYADFPELIKQANQATKENP
jgi:hypothetical protein